MKKILLSLLIVIAVVTAIGGIWIYRNQKEQSLLEKMDAARITNDNKTPAAKSITNKGVQLVVELPELANGKLKYPKQLSTEAKGILDAYFTEKGIATAKRSRYQARLSFKALEGPANLISLAPKVEVVQVNKKAHEKVVRRTNLTPMTVDQATGDAVSLGELFPDLGSQRAVDYQIKKSAAAQSKLTAEELTAVLHKNFVNPTSTDFELTKKGLLIAEYDVSFAQVSPFLVDKYKVGITAAGPTTKKAVALTFDDGPNPSTTPTILQTLKNAGVKGTFFMVGNGAQAYPSIAKQVKDAGHEIGNHSYDHPQLTSLNTAQVDTQITSTEQMIYAATGSLPDFVRPPYGAVDAAVSNIIEMPIIQWDVDTRDWATKNPGDILAQVQAGVHPGSIILMHDTHPQSVAALPAVISWLKSQGYELVTVSELLGQRLIPGFQYFGQNDGRAI